MSARIARLACSSAIVPALSTSLAGITLKLCTELFAKFLLIIYQFFTEETKTFLRADTRTREKEKLHDEYYK